MNEVNDVAGTDLANYESFPDKPIRLIVGHWRTGSTARMSRLLQPRLAALLGRDVEIDYVEGGVGGANGSQALKVAPADGDTMLMGTVGVISMLPNTYPDYGVDPLRDFVPVIGISDYPNILAAHRSLPVDSFDELKVLANKRPGQLTYILISSTSIHNLEYSAIIQEAGIPLKGVPPAATGGSGGAILKLLDGDIDLIMTTAPYIMPHVRSGAIKPLAIAAAERYFALPGTPTLTELGVKSTPRGSWMGLFVPAGTPRQIVDKLFTAAKAAADDDDLIRIAADEGMLVSTSESPDAFREFVENETMRTATAVETLGIEAR